MKYVYDEDTKEMLEVVQAVSRDSLALLAQETAADLAEYDRVLAAGTAAAEPEAPAAPAEPEVPAAAEEPTPPAVPAPGTEEAPAAEDVTPAEPTPPASETPAPAAAAKDEFGDDATDTREFE